MPQLETDRMTLRPIVAEDWRAMRAIQGDARAMATLSADGKPMTDEAIQAVATRLAAHWPALGFGVWFVVDRQTGAFCGYSGCKYVLLEGKPSIELAYATVPEFWRQGRAHEAADAVLQHMFEEVKPSEIWCFTLTTNTGSQRTMQKAGFVYSHDGMHADLPHVFYRQTRDAWLAAAT